MIPVFLLKLMQRNKLNWNWKLEPEQKESVKLADEMRARVLEGRYRGIWLHVANEGKRSEIVASIMKAMGMIPGASDYLFAWDKKLLWLELKIKPNAQSANQKLFQQWIEWAGYEYVLAYSKDEAIEKLQGRGAFV